LCHVGNLLLLLLLLMSLIYTGSLQPSLPQPDLVQLLLLTDSPTFTTCCCCCCSCCPLSTQAACNPACHSQTSFNSCCSPTGSTWAAQSQPLAAP
jgi:hypothetical protein